MCASLQRRSHRYRWAIKVTRSRISVGLQRPESMRHLRVDEGRQCLADRDLEVRWQWFGRHTVLDLKVLPIANLHTEQKGASLCTATT